MSFDRRRFTKPYMVLVIAVAAVVTGHAISTLQPSRLGLPFLILAAAALVTGSRVTVKLPGFKSEISLSEIFIFLAILQFDGEAAVVLGASEGFVSSLRISKKPLTRAFNAAVMACSVAFTVQAIRLIFGPLPLLSRGEITATMVSAALAMGLLEYTANSTLVALAASLRAGESFFTILTRYYVWTSMPYLAASCSALVTSRLIDGIGIYGLVLTVPIAALLYIAYHTHTKNMEASAAQAEQTKAHIAELSESEERFRSAFDNAAIGMALVSPEGRWLKVNRALCGMLGYSEAEFLTTDLIAYSHKADLGLVLSRAAMIAKGTLATDQIETRYMHRRGSEVWTLLSIARISDPQTHSIQLSFQIQDITNRKKAELQLLHDAFHDSLTGLPNRALFMDRLQIAMDRFKRSKGTTFAVLVLSLDRYKMVNESLGHQVGDQLLIAVARRLEAILRPGDTVARLGTDEISLLLEDIADVRDAILIVDRISRTISAPFQMDGHEVFTTVTSGIVPGSEGYERPADLLRDAFVALSRAHSLGRSRYEVFDHDMHARAVTQMKRETDLRRAIENGELYLQYHPIVSLRTGALEGFEALVRWRHPEEGIIPPEEFIHLAERSEMIHALGTWVLRCACHQVREWQAGYPAFRSLSMSVNLSGRQWVQPDIVEQILGVLEDTGCARGSLKLEITETILMNNVELVTAALLRLRNLGVEASMDDFGTGYSSLGYLHRLPVSTLKIDRSFVSSMSQNRESLEIVRTIVTLARSLYMNVVAEGIETVDQLEQLRALRCDQGQGYLFSRPLGAADAGALLASPGSLLPPFEHQAFPVGAGLIESL